MTDDRPSMPTENIAQTDELIQQLQKLRESASKDALTGLLNRGTAEEQIKTALENLVPGETCALFIIDLDHFKDVNDTLGHQTGDEVLIRAAHIISGLFRPTDTVGRLGGDEFVVFLHGYLTESVVRSKGCTICQQLQLTSGKSVQVTVTASVGICIASGPNVDFEILYRMADQALYKSKTEGRQRFHIARHEFETLDDSETDALNTISIPIKLSGILSAIDSGIALLSLNAPHHLIYANPYFRELIGLEDDAIAGQDLAELVHPEDKVYLKDLLKVRMDDEVFVHNLRIMTSDKTYIWIRVHGSLVNYDKERYAFMISASDISELKEKEKRLENINERLQTAFDQTGQGIWEVDLDSKRFRMYDDGFGSPFQKKAVAFPEDLIRNSWVHADSAAMLRRFADEIYQGNANGYGNFILRYPDMGTYQWAALSYTLLHDQNGRPSRAIGIIETLSQDLYGIQSLNYPNWHVPDALLPYLVLQIHANLSRDTVQNVWVEGKYMTGNPRWTACLQIFYSECSKIPDEQERARFTELFHPASLIRAYESGQHWCLMEYYRRDRQGNLQWCCFTTGLYQNDSDGDICMFSYLYRSETRHKWECDLQTPVERDPITNLYQRSTGPAITQMILNQRWENSTKQIQIDEEHCASVMISVNGLSDLRLEDRTKVRFYIASALNSALGTAQITAQHGDRKFFTFYPSVPSREKLLSRLEYAFEYVRFSLSGTAQVDRLTFIAGVYYISPDRVNADLLLRHSEELCNRWEDSTTDKIVFADEEEIQTQNELYIPDIHDRIWFYKEPHRRPLTEVEKEIRFQCVSRMLLADSLADSMKNLLELLGRFYKADRTYFLLLSGKKRIANVPCEWDAPGIREIQSVYSGQTEETLPLLRLCEQEKAPLFLARGAHDVNATDEWRYMLLPMPSSDVAAGYLCIENAKNCYSEDVLPNSLIPYIVREYQRYQSIRDVNYGYITPTAEESPYIREYPEELSRYNSDTYHTLGVLCIDIPDFPALNSTMGFDYGRGMLRFILLSASPVFGRNFVFRTLDSEFILLCPNTTEQVFLSKCDRLQRKISERYPRKIRVGQKWASSDFNGRNMAEQVRYEMRKIS